MIHAAHKQTNGDVFLMNSYSDEKCTICLASSLPLLGFVPVPEAWCCQNTLHFLPKNENTSHLEQGSKGNFRHGNEDACCWRMCGTRSSGPDVCHRTDWTLNINSTLRSQICSLSLAVSCTLPSVLVFLLKGQVTQKMEVVSNEFCMSFFLCWTQEKIL